MENQTNSNSISDPLRSELARLQDCENTLTHLLSLEKERRIRAEQLAEVEHQACLELSHRLSQERKIHSLQSSSRPLAEISSSHSVLASVEGTAYGGVACDMETVVCSIDFKNPTNEGDMTHGVVSSQSFSGRSKLAAASIMSAVTSGDDFASSVFSQLPTELQNMLRVGDSQEPDSKETVSNAVAAVHANDLDQLKKCISSLELTLLDRMSLLKLSCEKGHESCLRLLVEGGCDPNEVVNKETPLQLCVKQGHLKCLNTLLEFGANPNAHSKQSPLYLSLRGGHEMITQALIDTGADLTAKTEDGYTLLHGAVIGCQPHSLRKLLVHLRMSLSAPKFKEIINLGDKDGRTALHMGMSDGNRECVEILCACEELESSQRDRWNRTPMDSASEECRELIRNREIKLATVYIESSHSVGVQTTDSPGTRRDKTVAIGKVALLPHHRLSDVEYLVEETLKQYCDNLRCHPPGWRGVLSNANPSPMSRGTPESRSCDQRKSFNMSNLSVSEKIQGVFELSRAIKEANKNHGTTFDEERNRFLQECSNLIQTTLNKISPLDLDELSISSYRVGTFKWQAKQLEGYGKNIFTVFKDQLPAGKNGGYRIYISLMGSSECQLDQLAFELMVPVQRLVEYVDLVENHKAIIIHGPQGSGKTQLARGLAEHIKAKAVNGKTQIVHASLHPGFQRDDLLRLLHINGLLVQQREEESSEWSREGYKEKEDFQCSRQKTYIVILDNLSLLHLPTVLAELLTSLEYRGVGNPMWIHDVYSRDGSLLYPCGHYHLKSSAHFIVTMGNESSEEATAGSVWMDQFAHISLQLYSDMCCGVLVRQVMARLIDACNGDLPHSTEPVCRLVRWVLEVWILYNDLMRRAGLHKQLTIGVRHFVQCPIDSNDPEKLLNWLCSVWDHHLVPVIRSTLLATPTLRQPNHTLNDKGDVEHEQLVLKLLVACSELVFESTCPLNSDAKQRVLEQLRAGFDGEELEMRREGQRSSHMEAQKAPQPSSTQQHSKSPDKSTPPSSHHAHSSGKPPLPPQKGSMVSYEDMIRNSPRNKSKAKSRNQSTKSTKSMALDTNKSITLDNHKSIMPDNHNKSMALDNDKSMTLDTNKVDGHLNGLSPSLDPIVLRPKTQRKNTLRKIRSKTISMFFKDSATSTLPKLFRRGSRTSLSGPPEEFITHDTQLISHPKDVKQLEDVFDILSTANSKRFDDQCSPSPSSSSVSQRQGSLVKGDLDDFMDLLSSANSKRIDEQRSPPPRINPTQTKVTSTESMRSIPKYLLPTGSPMREDYNAHSHGIIGRRGNSPPTFSLPDLTADVDIDKSRCSTSHPVTRKNTTNSFSSYDSDMYDDNHQISDNVNYNDHIFSETNVIDKEPKRHHRFSFPKPNLRGKDSSKPFRGRAKTLDATTSAPTHRKLNMNIDRHPTNSSSSKSTPGMPHSCLGPTSPLATTSYSSPRNSPTLLSPEKLGSVSAMDDHEDTNGSRFDESSSLRLFDRSSSKARSAQDILKEEQDGLGSIDDFDLFRAVSEGDLMQSSTREEFLDFPDAENHISSVKGSSDYHQESVQPVNHISSQRECSRPSYAYQSSPENCDELDLVSPTGSVRGPYDTHTSGYGSDNWDCSKSERTRSNSASQTRRTAVSSPPYTRRYSQGSVLLAINTKREYPLPTSTLGQGKKNSSDTNSMFGSNLAYSASLGFNSLSRLCSSRDHLSHPHPPITEDLTEM